MPLLTFELKTLGYDYNYDDSNVILLASTLQTVVAAGATTVFTFEFYPREPDNVATYTVYV
jgi:endoglucanase